MESLYNFFQEHKKIPLSWVGGSSGKQHLNWGDALSPVMVALCSGQDVERIPRISKTPRLAAVGTIGHGFAGGEVYFWGTGCSPVVKTSSPGTEYAPYKPPANTKIILGATRGPISETLLAASGARKRGIYGDPVWLLPRFYNPQPVKRWSLGVILHLSELANLEYLARPLPQLRRYEIPDSMRNSITLINTITPVSVDALKAKLDEILACERIVSTSLHGMVAAEAYGIPCLYFGNGPDSGKVSTVQVAIDAPVNSRIVDLYGGLGLSQFEIFNQMRSTPTNWENLIAAIDRAWYRKSLQEDRLLSAFPFPLNMAKPPVDGSVFDLPLLQSLILQHDVSLVRKEDAKRTNISVIDIFNAFGERPTAGDPV